MDNFVLFCEVFWGVRHPDLGCVIRARDTVIIVILITVIKSDYP